MPEIEQAAKPANIDAKVLRQDMEQLQLAHLLSICRKEAATRDEDEVQYLTKHLRETEFFSRLTEEALAVGLEHLVAVRFQAGQALYALGEKAEGLYYIITG